MWPRPSALARVIILALACAAPLAGEDEKNPWPLAPNASASWELKLLGVDDAAKLKAVRDLPKRRRVSLAVVTQNGIGKKRLEKFFRRGNTLTFHDCADQNKTAHDTGQLEVVLDMTAALGVEVDVHVWQPGESFLDVAKSFREAGETVDVVCTYQSFWGTNAKEITKAIRESPAALVVSPYVEHGGKPTSESPQGSASRPWAEGTIPHFVTAAPLARRKSKGDILTPLDRGPDDTEAVNFIAPSHHANGTGGTCPAGGTTTACALVLYALMPEEPTPEAVLELLRATVKIDRDIITSAPEFDEASVDLLEKKIKRFHSVPEGKQRKLDAPGVLNLYDACVKATRNTR